MNGTPLGDFEEHGTGWKALIAMVLVHAIIDADKGSEDAEKWLMGEGGKNCLQFLEIPVTFLAQRNRYPNRRMPTRPTNKRGRKKK